MGTVLLILSAGNRAGKVWCANVIQGRYRQRRRRLYARRFYAGRPEELVRPRLDDLNRNRYVTACAGVVKRTVPLTIPDAAR